MSTLLKYTNSDSNAREDTENVRNTREFYLTAIVHLLERADNEKLLTIYAFIQGVVR